jgi:hypothetical protein
MFGHLNPIVAMLRNTKLNRWHPILYLENPLPGMGFEADGNNKLVRHKSKFHHTAGFEKRDEAITAAADLIKQSGGTKTALDEDILWNGEDIPADVGFFAQVDGAEEHRYKRVM